MRKLADELIVIRRWETATSTFVLLVQGPADEVSPAEI
jgi:hypothetical protein